MSGMVREEEERTCRQRRWPLVSMQRETPSLGARRWGEDRSVLDSSS